MTNGMNDKDAWKFGRDFSKSFMKFTSDKKNLGEELRYNV